MTEVLERKPGCLICVKAGDRNYVIDRDLYMHIIDTVTEQQMDFYKGDSGIDMSYKQKPRVRIIQYLHRHALFIYYDKKIAGLRVRTMLRSAIIEINVDRLEQEFLSSDKIFTVK